MADDVIEIRTKKIMETLKSNFNWIFYIILFAIASLSVFIRTRNIPGLRDITTGTWTLGPDLDPFLFLRWTKYIIENGSLMVLDTMRYNPIGFNTPGELILLPYMMAWFHKIATIFGSESVTQSAVFFPVFMFALTVIAFFLLVKKTFQHLSNNQSSTIALISCFFLSIIPSLLPRTIAGIPEKESAGFFFIFISLYLFISAWKSDKLSYKITFSILCGITTAMMALVWGGFIYILLTIALALLIAFFLGQFDKKQIFVPVIWIVISYIIMSIYSTRYVLSNLINGTITLIPIAVVLLAAFHLLIFETKIKEYIPKNKLPKQLVSLIIFAILGLFFVLLLFGPGYITDKLNDLTKPLIAPITDRLGVTVAENRQPFFQEWASSFGPVVQGVPIFFWLFFIGSIYLYYNLLHILSKKQKIYSTIGYAIFLFAIIFSRNSPDSLLNGTNSISILVYILGVLSLMFSFGYFYFKLHSSGEESRLKEIHFGLIILFSLFFLSIISARGSVRTIMVLVPAASIIVAHLIVSMSARALHATDQNRKTGYAVFALIIIILSIYSSYAFYNESYYTASSYTSTNPYTQQWQKAMSWVRDNTPTNAVFGHWWDYGYWLQSIGERATVLDGGNALPYWNHLMGRHALTGPSSKAAAEFLYAHNTTHFLIDSTDIGKYTAFSSIGADENYDRYSWIVTMLKDPNQVNEKKNSTISFYQGGTQIDQDITYYINGTKIFLAKENSGIGGVLVEKDLSGNIISNPIGVFISNGVQYQIPLRYAFEDKLIDFGSGIDSGVFIFPRLDQVGSGYQVNNDGALLYLSSRTVNSQLARLYLYKQNDNYFKLIHSEDDFVVAQLRSQNNFNNDFVYYQGLRGPIRIWSINYPSDIQLNSSYLELDYPNKELYIAK